MRKKIKNLLFLSSLVLFVFPTLVFGDCPNEIIQYWISQSGRNYASATGVLSYKVNSAVTPVASCSSIYFNEGSSFTVNDWGHLTWAVTNATSLNLYCAIDSTAIVNDSGAGGANYGVQMTKAGTVSCVLTPYNGANAGNSCNVSAAVSCATGYIWNSTTSTCVPSVAPVNGVCGSANGTVSCTAPSANLCVPASAASTIAGSGPWIWTCAGSNGGNSVSCSVTKSCGGPSCTASFSPARITAPTSSDLTWSASPDTTSMTFYCAGPIPVLAGTAVSPLTGGPAAIPFDTPGTEICTFTPYNGTTPGPTCSASVIVDPPSVPTCTASFSPTSITIPGSSNLEWHSSANTTSLTTFCTGPIPVSSMSAVLNGGPHPISFTASGTETCVFTPFAGATAGTSCSATVYAGCECSLLYSGGYCPTGTTCDGCYCLPNSAFSCTGAIPVGSVMCSGSNVSLTENLSWTLAGTTEASCGTGKCKYYTPTTYSCLGSIPVGSTMCPGSNLGLSSNISWSSTGGNSLASCVSGEKCKYYSCPGTLCSTLPTCGTGTACGTYHQSCLPAPAGCSSCPAGSCTGSITCPCNSGGWQEVK